MICSGIDKDPRLPDITISEEYKGIVLHTHDYKDPSVFKDKRVLVIGEIPASYAYNYNGIHIKDLGIV